jgi:hypothetical protein
MDKRCSMKEIADIIILNNNECWGDKNVKNTLQTVY